MKRFFVSATGLAVAALASGTGSAMAAPMYYTFQGQITSIEDHAGIIQDAGLQTGSSISYTFLVDTEMAGYLLLADGSLNYDTVDPSYDYFYSDLLSNPPIQDLNGGPLEYKSWPTFITEYHGSISTPDFTQLYGGSGTNYTEVTSLTPLSSWTEGLTGLTGFTMARDANFAFSSLGFDLTLTSISSTAPGESSASVPEPGTLLLIGSGMAGLGIMRKFKKKA